MLVKDCGIRIWGFFLFYLDKSGNGSNSSPDFSLEIYSEGDQLMDHRYIASCRMIYIADSYNILHVISY